MKAVVCCRYGSPDVLQFTDVDTPAPKNDEALVKVHTTSVNAADLEMLRGTSGTRLSSLPRPAYRILGSDVAGTIVEVGENVGRFKPSDEIWGDLSFPYGYGTFAEYVCVHKSALRRKPAGMTFEEAAAFPTAGVVALQNLTGKRPILPGQKVLINGAGGSVGTFAVQIAKHFGAEVTGVDRGKKLEMIRSIGADHAIDFEETEFTVPVRDGGEQRYDLILDVVVRRFLFRYKRVLMPGGICVMVGGSLGKVFLNVALGSLLMRQKKIGLVTWRPNRQEDLGHLAEFFEAGEVKPVIAKRYPLKNVAEAFRCLESGEALGKIIISVEQG